MPSYFRSLEHLLRYCARPPFALERLSVRRGLDGRIAQVRYLLPRHKAANWVGPGRGRKSTRPGANSVVELSPFAFLDRLARSRIAGMVLQVLAGDGSVQGVDESIKTTVLTMLTSRADGMGKGVK